ncbi:MAG: NAD(P)H-binding protein [Ignavibacteriae bacterium]|nr:NAD(P)H-binding protein [Ignavibacteria bacterium]MBI3363622.1 NAD(P)H-binding protein [Ignavibacteriota bacterium]
MTRTVFITGASGYIGRHLIPTLLERGHTVKALVREGSKTALASGCTLVCGDALKKETFVDRISPADTFIQLVGVTHPNPARRDEFRSIDFASATASVAAARETSIRHFVYVSVAQPAPIMKAYQQVRADAEALIRASGLRATILRPWYVIGPGRRWPLIFVPVYWLLEKLPSTRASAQRLALVNVDQMIAALVYAVENPPDSIHIVEVPHIRQSSLKD